jgi:hypothetical protein
LGKLPGEIRDRIWWYAIAHEYDVILLAVRILWTQKRTNPSPWFWDIIHLVGVCQQMRSEIFHSVHRNITFVHEKVYLGYTTAFFPRSILQCVGVLELTDWGFLCNFFEHDIAKSLSLICDHLPNLIRFQLRATVHKESDVAPTMTRNLLRFGAFLVAKHQNLDLLIWPGDSGETYVRDEEMILFYIDVASSRHFATKRLFRAPAPKYLSERDAENDDISMVEVSISLCACLFSVLTDRFAGSFVERHDAATAAPQRYPCPFNRRLHHRQREQHVLRDRRGA